ncbi:hypothetical protein LTR97_003388 [Elasticomyces elasticus]|uniref:Alpha-type protein kinase domain-containing protein n=1 Tax=Elasticomyces elasticus TaxID=574655 RepID=A0AAN7WEF0_9PEZI|nr:hypothetical protein LTR97_003388 [Elasticomyces elasticus]
MASPPSVSKSSGASVSRSKISRDKLASAADSMLLSAVTRSNAFPAPPGALPASASRSRTSREHMSSLADDLLRASLTKSRGTITSMPPPSEPPSYRTQVTVSPGAQAETLKRRKSELQQELDRAKAKVLPRNTKGLFRAACSTDLMFVIDATNSMEPYIDAAKENVKKIVADIRAAYLGESDVRIAVAIYRDHQCQPNIEFLDFTTSVEDVHQFLDRVGTDWGRDFPEDVLGGLQQALHASWKQQTRCLIHIGDAPPHGQGLHDMSASSDNFYTPGSEPHRLVYQPLIANLVQLNINYVLLRIGSYTDRMSLTFAQVYGDGNAKLNSANKYYNTLHSGLYGSGTSSHPGSLTGRNPQYEELQLGSSYHDIRHLVVSTVSSSIARTAGRLTLSLKRVNSPQQAMSPNMMTAIQEDEDSGGTTSSRTKVPLETIPPRWDTPSWFTEKLEMEGFCPDVMVHDASTLSDMMDAPENIKLSVVELTINARPQPFAQGSLRTAAYARTAISTNPFVLKKFIDDSHGRAEVAEDMRMQALCKAFALEFNGLLKIEPPLDFIVTSCLQSKTGPGATKKKTCCSLEPYIPGTYVKYNNNAGWVNEDLADDQFNQMAQAFSHFTFERSWGHLLVDDLQGVGHLLTDPSVQTKDDNILNLNDTNLHVEGFKFFFAAHKCNSFCEQLGLISSGDMLITGDFNFRERWPTMDPTVCCSNKLCRSIIHLASAHQSNQYPDLHWCDKCWPQLQASMAITTCLEAGPPHKFEVSSFYHESQGQVPPRKCPAHRGKDTSGSSAAAVGGNLWNKMKSAGPTGSISGRSW